MGSRYYSVCMEHGDYVDKEGTQHWGAKETLYLEIDEDCVLSDVIKEFMIDYQRVRGTTKVELLNVRPYVFPRFIDYRTKKD